MRHEPQRTGATPVTAHGLGLVALAFLTAAIPSGRARADAQISGGGIHIPTVTNFCGGTETIIEATICNEDDQAHTFDVEFFDGGTPPAYPCTESLIPQHQFLDPVPVAVGAGQCKTLRIRVTRPVELDVHASICYWIKFTPETGGTVGLGAQLIDSFFGCVNWAFEEQVIFMHPLDPVILNPRITNASDEFIVFDYLIEVRDPQGSTEQGIIVLNDGGFAEPVVGSVDLGPGETREVELTAEWFEPDVGGFFDVVLLGDVPAPGRQAPLVTWAAGPDGGARRSVGDIASIGLAMTTAVVAIGEPGTPAHGREELRVSPNPWRDGGVVFGFDSPQAWSEALVCDATGRIVRSLSAGVRAPVTHIAWDGRDDAGHLAPPGVYFARVTTSAGVQRAKVVRVR